MFWGLMVFFFLNIKTKQEQHLILVYLMWNTEKYSCKIQKYIDAEWPERFLGQKLNNKNETNHNRYKRQVSSHRYHMSMIIVVLPNFCQGSTVLAVSIS